MPGKRTLTHVALSTILNTLIAFAAGGGGAWIVFSQLQAEEKPSELQLETLAIIDDEGKERITLSIPEEIDGPRIRVLNEDGKIQCSLGIGSDGSYLAIEGKHENTGLVLGYTEEKQVSLLSMRGSEGHARLLIYVDGEGPAVALFDKEKRLRTVLGVTTTVQPKTGEEARAEESTLTLFDATGKEIWRTP